MISFSSPTLRFTEAGCWVDGVVVPVSVGEDGEGGLQVGMNVLPGRSHPLPQHRIVHSVSKVDQSVMKQLFFIIN